MTLVILQFHVIFVPYLFVSGNKIKYLGAKTSLVSVRYMLQLQKEVLGHVDAHRCSASMEALSPGFAAYHFV